MRVAAELGLEYLWVDAVCILQNDSEEMVQEIAKMGDIYQGATFTIATSTALSNDEGFLGLRSAKETYGVQFEDETERRIPLMLFHHPTLPSEYPLHSRGWALQEGNSKRVFETDS